MPLGTSDPFSMRSAASTTCAARPESPGSRLEFQTASASMSARMRLREGEGQQTAHRMAEEHDRQARMPRRRVVAHRAQVRDHAGDAVPAAQTARAGRRARW
jgi:hypothetical protein